MSRRVEKVFVGILRWLLKEWVKALLAALSIFFISFLAWVFRSYIKDWLISKHYLEMYGFVWLLVVFIISVIPISLFSLITRKSKQDIYVNEVDIKNILADYWLERRKLHEGRPRWRDRPRYEFTIHCSNVDKREKLKKGSSAKFLPEVIENDDTYRIKSKGEKTIVVQRKGLTMKVGPDSPNGIIL